MSEGATLDPIWDAVQALADEGTIRGRIDYSEGDGTGLLTFEAGGVAYTVDVYRSEDVKEARPTVGA